MNKLEEQKERDILIDDYFNKNIEVDKRELYFAIVNTVADLEHENSLLKEELKKYEQ